MSGLNLYFNISLPIVGAIWLFSSDQLPDHRIGHELISIDSNCCENYIFLLQLEIQRVRRNFHLRVFTAFGLIKK